MNSLTPVDVYAIMNEVVSQATGRTDLAVVDTSSFVSVGETLLRTGTETTLNAISTVLARTIFSIRPYKAKLDSLRVGDERWGAQIRKITYLYDEAEESTDMNAASHLTTLDDGNSIDHYKIRKPKCVQLNFYGESLLQKHITRFRHQLDQAFRSESEFAQFVDGVMVEFFNEVELLNEGKSRSCIANFIGGIHDMGLTEVDLVAEYNTKYGTTKTRDDLLSTDLVSFMQFVASTIKTYSSRLTDMSAKYHANLTGKPVIMRHTPKSMQKMFMYEPFFIETQATVYSQIFNPKYLDIGTFEGVNFWQSQNAPTTVKVKPNILNVADGKSKTGNQVEIPYVLGILFDENACGVQSIFDYSAVTPMNAAGGYSNIYYHWKFREYCDYTENAVLFVLGEGGEPSQA